MSTTTAANQIVTVVRDHIEAFECEDAPYRLWILSADDRIALLHAIARRLVTEDTRVTDAIQDAINESNAIGNFDLRRAAAARESVRCFSIGERTTKWKRVQ
jgi:hypothetical protein